MTQLGIRPALMGASALLLVVTVGGIGALAVHGTQEAVDEQLDQELKLITTATTSEVKRLLEPAPQLILESAQLMDRGVIRLDEPEQLAETLVVSMRAHPTMGWHGISGPEFYAGGTTSLGHGLRAYHASPESYQAVEWRLWPDGRREPVADSYDRHYDPGSSSWYADSVADPSLRWSEPYVFTAGAMGITVYKGQLQDGEVVGVWVVDFFLEDLENWLHEQRVGERGRVFLITEQGAAIGHESEALRDAVLSAEGDRFEVDGERWLLSTAPLELQGGAHWRIAVAVPEDQLNGAAQEIMRRTGLLGLVVLVLSLGLSAWLATSIARPFLQVTRRLEDMAELRMDLAPLPPSSIREAGQLGASFELMRAGLRSFSHYVPMDLVRSLLADGRVASLGVEEREITVMFTDIADFTTTSESTEPHALVEALAEYMEMVNRCVQAEGGALISYMGDGVYMAWGAPTHQDDHALRACRCALEIDRQSQALVEKNLAAGKPILRTRVGVNTGLALVGNIGARERFNYSPIGDSVNTAARIEAINKSYGTRVLIGEQTQSRVAAQMQTREVDVVVVKGKTEGVRIYELLGGAA